MHRLFIALVVLVCVALGGPVDAFASTRVALVIGNGAYENHPALANPLSDASDIAASLKRLGFSVTVLTNARDIDMRKAIDEFGLAAQGSDIAVVFFAGHGMEIGGENWLLPVNVRLRNHTDVESEAVNLRSLMSPIGKARQLGLVILDASRDNPFAATMPRVLPTRPPLIPAENVLIAYAVRAGEVAADGNDRNSPFTTALLRHLETPGLEVSSLFRNVRDDVLLATGNRQQPLVYSSLPGSAIYLKRAAGDAPMPARK